MSSRHQQSGPPSLADLSLQSSLFRCGVTPNAQIISDAAKQISVIPAFSTFFNVGVDNIDFTRSGSMTASGTLGDGATDQFFLTFNGGFLTRPSNPAWVQTLHKNGAKWSFLTWVRLASLAAEQSLFGTFGSALTSHGVHFRIATSGVGTLRVANGSGTVAMFANSPAFSAGQFTCFGVSVDEAAASGAFMMNGVITPFNATYSAPSAVNATNILQVGTEGNGVRPLTAGSRMAMVGMWDVALGGEGLAAIFNFTRQRLGV